MSQAEIFRDIGRRMRYRTLATAAANQTYAQQLAQLKPVWDELTLDEKLRCILVINSTGKNVFTPFYSALGTFTAVLCTSTTPYLYSLDLTNLTYYWWNGSTIQDYTNNNNPVTLFLMLLE